MTIGFREQDRTTGHVRSSLQLSPIIGGLYELNQCVDEERMRLHPPVTASGTIAEAGLFVR